MDASAKGRLAFGERNISRRHPERLPRGEVVRWAKLTEVQAREILETYSGKRGEIIALARRFGVTRNVVAGIVQGTKWRHLSNPDLVGLVVLPVDDHDG